MCRVMTYSGLKQSLNFKEKCLSHVTLEGQSFHPEGNYYFFFLFLIFKNLFFVFLIKYFFTDMSLLLLYFV